MNHKARRGQSKGDLLAKELNSIEPVDFSTNFDIAVTLMSYFHFLLILLKGTTL